MTDPTKDLAAFMAEAFWDCRADPQGAWKALSRDYKAGVVGRMTSVLERLEGKRFKVLPQSPTDLTLKRAGLSRVSYHVSDYVRIWDASDPRPLR
jgi:hypothetical protein